jgi:hypothetical protein
MPVHWDKAQGRFGAARGGMAGPAAYEEESCEDPY